MISIAEGIKYIIWGMRINFAASKYLFFAKSLLLGMLSALPIINIVLWRAIINLLSDGTNTIIGLSYLLSLYLCVKVIIYVITKVDRYIQSRYNDYLRFYIEDVMIQKTTHMDLSFYDSNNMQNRIHRIRGVHDNIGNLSRILFDITLCAINIVTTASIIFLYRWWIGLLCILIMFPGICYNIFYSKKRNNLYKKQVPDYRIMGYYQSVFYDSNTQFEVRLYNASEYFLHRFKTSWLKIYHENMKNDSTNLVCNIIIQIMSSLSEFLILMVSVLDVLANKIQLGDIQFNLNAMGRLKGETQKFLSLIGQFSSMLIQLKDLKDFMDIEVSIETNGSIYLTQCNKIEFENVSFAYPECHELALNQCSFCIKANEICGLVGENGSGKTTIVKLLLRFYDPQTGVIRINDIDIREYDIYSVRKQFGVMFQDYVSYCLPIREIIALPDFVDRFNDNRLIIACQNSGADTIISGWKKGLDSVIGRYYENEGEELSGGQWQTLCLSRVYFGQHNCVILDEPSAALDPIAENRMIHNMYSITRKGPTIIISHRLSNIAMADKIIVIDRGSIVEEGTHKSLMNQNGVYAKLFNIQASKF